MQSRQIPVRCPQETAWEYAEAQVTAVYNFHKQELEKEPLNIQSSPYYTGYSKGLIEAVGKVSSMHEAFRAKAYKRLMFFLGVPNLSEDIFSGEDWLLLFGMGLKAEKETRVKHGMMSLSVIYNESDKGLYAQGWLEAMSEFYKEDGVQWRLPNIPGVQSYDDWLTSDYMPPKTLRDIFQGRRRSSLV